ncbi:MAG TPA: tRNA (guanosine(37)-N1)-methyltransferase TrmD [Candidatus Paceibacterota bacterium]|jgi:tRNA (guanine37-N1)-methyltransferase|nr:tRNA (guanosine(37)-N1)-methyltransferase TrmD [Candidatus Paceibacterota bacterium]
MRFHIITIFPNAFDSYLKESIIARAIKNKKISVRFYNPRDFLPASSNNYRPVDDRPYGGGPGMVMRPEPILKAVEKAIFAAQKFSSGPRFSSRIRSARPLGKIPSGSKIKILILSPSGKKFTTAYAKSAAKKYTDIIMISGRYEGIDARVKKIFKAEDISVGDYVLTGGELPAMVLLDSISRQIPGVLGKYESLEEERVSSSEVYTRPEVLKYKGKNYRVPKVLLSGDHKKIEEWKKGK